MDISYQIENLHFLDISPTDFSVATYEPEVCIHSTHHFYSFFLTVSGEVSFEVEKKKYSLAQDNGILVYPEQEFSFKSATKEPITVVSVGFYGIKAEQILSTLNINNISCTFEYPINAEIFNYFNTGGENLPNGEFLALSFIYRIFSSLYNPNLLESNVTSNAISYINEHIYENIRVQDIADHLCISRIYLYNCFEKNIGVSPKKYITDQKLLASYEMLKKKKMTVYEVAQAVGYPDPFAFSKIFKKKYGLSPRDIINECTPSVYILDDEKGECVWPAEITQERAKVGTNSLLTYSYYDKEKNNAEGWLIRATYIHSHPLPHILDISLLTNNGKSGKLTFWIFIENMCNISNWCINNKDWIRFGSSPDWDTDFQYWLGWHDQIKKEGWNKIVLPFGDSRYGHIVGNPDYKKMCSFGMILSIPHDLRIFIDDLKVTSD